MSEIEILTALEAGGLFAILLYAWLQERKERQAKEREFMAMLKEVCKGKPEGSKD